MEQGTLDLITNFGLPTAAIVLIAAWLRIWLERLYADSLQRDKEQRVMLDKYADILKETSVRLEDTLEEHGKLDTRMESAEEKLILIDNKLGTIHTKVEDLDKKIGTMGR